MMIRKIRCCELRSLCWIKDDDTFDASVGGWEGLREQSKGRHGRGGIEEWRSRLELKMRDY